MAPKWFMDELDRGDAVSRPLLRATRSKRNRFVSEVAIWRDFSPGKRSHDKGRQEQYAKSAEMTTAALNDDLYSQVNQACAVAALQDEYMGDAETNNLNARDEEMDDAERSEREVIRNPRVPTCTFALSHAMSADDSSDAVLFCFTSPTPRTISALCITSSIA